MSLNQSKVPSKLDGSVNDSQTLAHAHVENEIETLMIDINALTFAIAPFRSTRAIEADSEPTDSNPGPYLCGEESETSLRLIQIANRLAAIRNRVDEVRRSLVL